MRKINYRKGGVMEEMGPWEKLEEISAGEKIRVLKMDGITRVSLYQTL